MVLQPVRGALSDINWRPLGELVYGIVERLAKTNDFPWVDPDLADAPANSCGFIASARVSLREQLAEVGARHLMCSQSEATVRHVQRLDSATKASATG